MLLNNYLLAINKNTIQLQNLQLELCHLLVIFFMFVCKNLYVFYAY